MVTIGMNYEVLPGKEEVFEKAFERVLDAMQGNEGHSETRLYKNVHSNQSYLIVSEWNDRSAFDDFVRSDAFAKVTQWGKEQVLAARPNHTVYEHASES